VKSLRIDVTIEVEIEIWNESEAKSLEFEGNSGRLEFGLVEWSLDRSRNSRVRLK
jgi:hypothetical protein